MKFDATIKEDRAEVRKTNKEEIYGFLLKLSWLSHLTGAKPRMSPYVSAI